MTKIKIAKHLDKESGDMIFTVQVKPRFIWRVEFSSKNEKKAEEIYREILKSKNVEKG